VDGNKKINMGFKLGKERGNYAVNGEIRTKMRFGKQSGNTDISIPGTPIIRKNLGINVGGEANMDGSIYISDKLEPGSFEERKVINHEMRHATDIKIGKLAYEDDHIMYNGERFERQNIDGIDSILVEGNWKQAGDHGFPWELDANNGNKEV
tara:strand:+ start:721 stop:1176 length:456 start_codon:yes stop_codon:yes gene_type:complete